MALKPKSPTELLQPEDDLATPVETLAGSRYTGQDYVDRAQAKQAARIQQRGSFSRGLEQGVAGMAEAWHGAGALTSAILGDDEGMAESAQQAREYSDIAQRVAPDITSVSQIKDAGDLLSFIGAAAGQMAPSLATVIAGGGAGALIGKTLGQTVLKKTMAEAAKRGGATVAQRGAQAGAIGTGVGLESGSLGAQTLQPDFDSKMTPRERAFLSLAGGAAAGSLEALPALNILGRYGLGGQAKKALQSSIKAEAGKQALQEGSTEAAQQLIQRTTLAIADQNREVLGEEGIQELIDSFAMGAVGGGIVGGGTRAVTRGAEALRDRAARRDVATRPEAEVPTTQGVEVTEGVAPDIEEIEITAPTTQMSLMESFDEDLPGFSEQEIQAEIFGDVEALQEEGLPPPEVPGLEAIRAEQTKAEFGTAEDLPAAARLAEDLPEPAGSFAPAETEVESNILFDKVTRDSRGTPIRELPYEESTVGGWERLDKRLDKLNEGQEGQPYQALGMDEAIKRQAQREAPGNRARQAEFIKEKAAVVSETRKKQASKIQPGEDPLQYLSKFRVIEGPPTVRQEGATVGGAVPGDLTLTPEDLEIPVGEIRGELGIKDKRGLQGERIRRQILRKHNVDTVNQGLNANRDIVLEKRSKGNPGKVLNATSLTSMIRDRANKQQGDDKKSLAQKAGEWFTAGVASLNEAGHTLNIADVPADTIIMSQGKKNITWAQAQAAMGGAEARDVPNRVKKLNTVLNAITRDKKAGRKFNQQKVADALKFAGYNEDEVAAISSGTPAQVRKALSREIVKQQKRGTEFEVDPTQLEKEGIPTDEGKPMRPIRRQVPSTGRKVARGVSPETVIKEGGQKFLNQARNATKGPEGKPLGKLRANAIAKNLSEATGKTVSPDKFAGMTPKEAMAELKKYSQRGQRVVQKTQTGFASQITTDAEVDLIRRSTDDMSFTETMNTTNEAMKTARIARKMLQGHKVRPGDNRLMPNERLEQALRDAGLEFKREELFYDSEKGGPAAGTKSRVMARLQQKIDANKQVQEAARTREEAVEPQAGKGKIKGAPRDKIAMKGLKKPAPTPKSTLERQRKEREAQIARAEKNLARKYGSKKAKEHTDKLRDELRKQLRKEADMAAEGPTMSDRTPDRGAQIDKAVKDYETYYNATTKEREKYQGLIDAVWPRAGSPGVKVHLLTPKELRSLLTEQNPDSSHAMWIDKVLAGKGSYGTKITRGNKHMIYLRPDLKPGAEKFTVFAHEFGHAIEAEMINNADGPTLDALFDAWREWREANNLDTAQFEEFVNTRAPLGTRGLFGGEGLTMADLDPAYREYMTSFSEWFADQTARYFTHQPEAQSLVGAFFKELADMFKQMFSFARENGYTPHKTVTAFYNDVLGTVTTNAHETYSDHVMASIKAVQPSLSDEQARLISRYAKAAFRAENREIHDDAELAAFAAQIALDAGVGGAELNYAAMRAAYSNLLNTKEREVLHRAFSTQAMQNRVRELLRNEGDNVAARAVMADADAAIVYGYQLWDRGLLKVGPKTETMFQRLLNRVSKILGIVRDSENAQAIFQAMRENNVLVREELGNTEMTFASPRQHANTMVQKATTGMRKLGQVASPMFDSVFKSAYSRMQDTKNLWLAKLAKEFYVPPGSQGQRQGFLEAKNIKLAEFHNRVSQILQGKDAEFKSRVAKAMATGKFSRNAEVRQTQEELKGLMEEMRTYLVDAGVEIGSRANREAGYWPWVFDTETLLRDGSDFKDALVRNMPPEFIDSYVSRTRGKAKFYDKSKVSTREEVAARVYESIMRSKGYGDGGTIHDYDGLSHTPYMGSHDTRILDWLAEEPNFERFMSDNLDKTLISYIDQSVKRAEFARRFDDNGEKIREYLAKAETAGMTPEQRKLAQQYVSALMGTLGGDINPQLRKAMSYVMVYENLRLLSMSLFSSLVDPMGILVRTGSVQDSMVAMRAGFREIADWMKRRKGQPGATQDARILAQTIGSIEDAIGKEALGYEYGGAYMTGPARQLNEYWFEVTGIAGYTRMTRVMAVAAAQNFLKRHAQGLDKHSDRYLDELGVTARDVRFDREGNLRLLTPEERQSASDARIAADDRLRNAIFRFVDEAILRPDSAQRPIYGSDPHFMLVFHLKGFMYSFYERIMKRAWNEAAQHGNLVPMASLGMYVPGMVAADMLRDAVKDAFGDQDDDRRDDWTAWDWAGHGLERSGLYGPYVQQLADAKEDYERFGKLPGISMFGPAAEHAVDLVTMRGGLDNQLVRAMPGQNLVEPLTESLMGNFE